MGIMGPASESEVWNSERDFLVRCVEQRASEMEARARVAATDPLPSTPVVVVVHERTGSALRRLAGQAKALSCPFVTEASA